MRKLAALLSILLFVLAIALVSIAFGAAPERKKDLDITGTLRITGSATPGIAGIELLPGSYAAPQPCSSIGGGNDIDWRIAECFSKTISSNTALTFSNIVDGKTIRVFITDVNSSTLTWPSGIKWEGGTIPSQTTTGKTDEWEFHRSGSETLGHAIQNFSVATPSPTATATNTATPTSTATVTATATSTATSTATATATVTATPTFTPGTNTNSGLFDGTNDTGSFAAQVLNPNADFTFEAWVKTDTNADTNTIIGADNGATDYWMILLRTDSDGLSFQFDTGLQPLTIIGSGISISSGTWHHIAVRRSGNTWTFMDNGGTPTCSTNCSSSVSDLTASATIKIGALNGSAFTNFYDGHIDEIRIWTIVRTQAEINAYKNQAMPETTTGLNGVWKFEEGSGTDVDDSSPNNNHMTLNNGATFDTDVPF